MTANDATIFERIQAAQRDIAKTKFEKTQKVKLGDNGGYYIIPVADILQAVRKAQAEHGITLLIGKVQFDKEDYETSTGGHAIGHVDYRLVGRDMEDSIEGTVTVEARDTSDKLCNKLITNQMRTIYRTVYSIDAGEDPENENAPARGSFWGKATATTTDRDPEVMAQTILKAEKDGICASTIAVTKRTQGDDPRLWNATTLRQIYAAVINRRREAEA